MIYALQSDLSNVQPKQDESEFSGLDSLASAAMMGNAVGASHTTAKTMSRALHKSAESAAGGSNLQPQFNQHRKCELCNLPNDGGYGTVCLSVCVCMCVYIYIRSASFAIYQTMEAAERYVCVCGYMYVYIYIYTYIYIYIYIHRKCELCNLPDDGGY